MESNGSAKGWAEECRFKYLTASSKKAISAVMDTFLSQSEKPILLEVFTHGDDEEIAIDKLISANLISTPRSTLNRAITSLVGESGKQTIKRILGK